MNVKKFILTSIVVFIVYEILTYVVHGLILGNTYMAMPGVWRQDMQSMMWIMWLGALFFCFMFVFVFTKGYEGKGIGEGVRFGLIIGLLMVVVQMLDQYVIYPVPFGLVLQWIVFGLIQYIILGIVAALLYKPAK